MTEVLMTNVYPFEVSMASCLTEGNHPEAAAQSVIENRKNRTC